MPGRSKSQEVRIIGGKWRGRKLRFHAGPDLRPTLGRMRETLFNWLRSDIDGAHCLDLFAGSGILGFEALSQGAAHTTFVDVSRTVCRQLQSNLATLEAAETAAVVCRDAPRYLDTVHDPFEIIFLDPPFARPELLTNVLTGISSVMNEASWCYVEVPKRSRGQALDLLHAHHLNPDKESKAGDTFAYLCRLET